LSLSQTMVADHFDESVVECGLLSALTTLSITSSDISPP
jgi:hypothetical protein